MTGMESDLAGERGETLLEVLVAVLILVVGVLGLAGMQAASLRQTQDALLASEAILLASDLVERIRANPGGDYRTQESSLPSSVLDCEVESCNPAELAAYDLAEWQCALNSRDDSGNSLPVCQELGIQGFGGTGSVTSLSGAIQVHVQWRPGQPEHAIELRSRTHD